MRPEKKFLVQEASEYLNRSDFFFLTDYKGIDAEETTELRQLLADRGAEFHVVKNSSLRIATKEKEMDAFEEYLTGHTAIVFGGEDASSVAKVSVKAGALGDRVLTADEVKQLAKLPGLESLRAHFLSLLNTSASHLLSVMSAPARGFVTVLKAKADKN